MAHKITILLFASISLVVSFTIHPRIARQADQESTTHPSAEERADQSNGLQSYIQGFGGGSGGNGFDFGGFGSSIPGFGSSSQGSNQENGGQGSGTQGNDSNNNSNGNPIPRFSGNGLGGIGSGMGAGVVQRFRNALNNTANEQIDSVKDSWRSVKNLGHQGINTKSNITKTYVDFALMGPRFAKHLFLN